MASTPIWSVGRLKCQYRQCYFAVHQSIHVQIILGLVSHEPRFALLREEVKFGKNQKVSSGADCAEKHEATSWPDFLPLF